MTVRINANLYPMQMRVGASYTIRFDGVALGAGVTLDHPGATLILDFLNNQPPPTPGPGTIPCVGYEETLAIHVASGPTTNATLIRQFATPSGGFFDLTPLSLVPGTVTERFLFTSLLRFPAFTLFRYRIENTDVVNATTINGIITLRAL